MLSMLRSLVTDAVFSRRVASAQSARFVATAEGVFGVLVMVVVGCSRVLGRRNGKTVLRDAGESFLSPGFEA